MFDVVIVAGGNSVRAGVDKLSFDLNGVSVLSRTINCFKDIEDIAKIIVVSDKKLEIDGVIYADSGKTRAQSVKNGLTLANSPYCLIHDGARPFVTKNLIKRVMEATILHNSCIPALKATDSLRRVENGLIAESFNREQVVCVQTPQGFATNLLKQAFYLSCGEEFTDESAIFAEYVLPPFVIDGEITNKKITYFEDLANLNCKVGSGFDVHKFIVGKKLILGGIEIPYDKGMEAHSDGDVVLHAVMDAILSCIGDRDIGVLFPDTDPEYKNIDSSILLKQVLKLLNTSNKTLSSVTITIIAQEPKLATFIPLLRKKIATLLGVAIDIVSLNATTTETLGIVGEKKGIAVLAFASVV